MTTPQARRVARLYNAVFRYGERFTHPFFGECMTVGPAWVQPATRTGDPLETLVSYRRLAGDYPVGPVREILLDTLVGLLANKYPMEVTP